MTHSPKQTGWEISEVRTVDGEFMVCGGEGHSFGLIATVTREEDARLIAATHDLYEALEAAAPMVETLHSLTPPSEGRKIVWSIVKQTRAALSKARPSNGGEA